MARPATAAVRLLTGEREPVRLATTANIALSGLQTIDGTLTEVGDRVLVKNQTDQTTNGIYTASAGVWYRAADARTSRTMQKGTTVHVQQGTVNAGNVYVFSASKPNIGTDNIVLTLWLSDDAISDINTALSSALLLIQDAVSGIQSPKATIAAVQADAPLIDPDYYIVAHYDSNRMAGSGAKYKKVAVQPSHDGKVPNANGTWYEINEPVLTPQMFGYVSGNVTSYFQKAIVAGNYVYFPPFSGYTATTSFSQTLTSDKIIDGGHQVSFAQGIVWELKGPTVRTGLTIASNVQRYAATIPLNSVTDIQAGDLFYVNSPGQQPDTGWSDTRKDCALISSVNTGTTSVVLAAGVNFSYDSSETNNVEIYRPVKVTLNRPNFYMSNPLFGTQNLMLNLVGLRDIEIISPILKAPILGFNRTTDIYRIGIQIWKCWGWKVTDAYYEGLSYPIGVYGGTRNGFEYKSKGYYCHHAHADLGDWSSDYVLDGLFAWDNYQGLSTHPCFRAEATNFNVQNDYEVSNWRTIGGRLSKGRIQTTASDTESSAQFQNYTPNTGYSYLDNDANFSVTDVEFSSPNRSTKDAFWVSRGNRVYVANILVQRLTAFTSTTNIALFTAGPGIVSRTGTTFRAPGNYINGVLQ